MRTSLFAFLFLAVAGSVHAAPSTIKQCNDSREPVAGTPWLPAGATANACHQMVAGSPIHQAFDGMPAGKIVAFRNGVVTAIKQDRRELLEGDSIAFAESDWIEHGSLGPTGQLWWGRTDRWHVFAGQETHERLRQEVTQMPVKEQMAVSRWYMARMQAMMTKAPMPVQAGDDKYTVFGTRKRMSYRQAGATMATFEGGYGGDGQIAPGMIEHAKLKLDIGPVLSGVLTFSIKISGQPRVFTIPVVSAGEPQRLHAAIVAGGNHVKCKDRPGRVKPKDPEACPLSSAQPAELYDGQGAFFGDHAALAAFQFRFSVNIPDRNRRESISTGVIVLESEP